MPHDFAMAFCLINAGNISDNCTVAAAWYHSHNLESSSVASLGADADDFNLEDLDFMEVAASSWVEDFTSFMSNITNETVDRDVASFLIYPQLANLTNPIGDAVLNITRPAIELHCISEEMAKAVSRAPGGDCEADLVRWWPPGLHMEASDMINDMQQAFISLPEEYKNVSIQTFFGWMGHQNLLGPSEIGARKQECYQTLCSSLENSGNPDIAGIGMFISYIIEACLATFFILHSCWHNWKHRQVLFSNSPASVATSEDFTRIMDIFLNTGVVLLLSLAAALVTVGSHETVLYNGVITHLACHFSASAVIAVASLPRYGSHRHPAFWVCLLCSTLLSTIAMNIASQYDLHFTMPGLSEDNFWESQLAAMQLLAVPKLQFSTGALGYPGLQQISQPDPGASFTVASCLIWGFFYYDGDIEGFITSYVSFSFYFQEVIYFVGILVFFVLTLALRARTFHFWPSWIVKNKARLVFWLRCAFSFVAWMNMFMGLGCITLWRRFQSVAMGSYYSEAAVGYGQGKRGSLSHTISWNVFGEGRLPTLVSRHKTAFHFFLYHHRDPRVPVEESTQMMSLQKPLIPQFEIRETGA
ncbi:hypothetical protein CkaCkLH20_11782 [Colletotrichum karsti]|uniref:Uncharacterized protein n=1 Tax=Colletotrichum karsti TaxID=1095194 RepID=A0A9P6HV59_9PEZI|nr:uncharacterized protein CkaCkLH20_11782 [Colletotrichum karsti]KAF9870680.1 hypothetical protein CkaCkLH20_11782 [Colletotrichum karsti]